MTPRHTDDIDCHTAFRRLYDYLDGELDDSELEAIEHHLSICEVCAREFRFESTVLDEIRTRLRNTSLPPDLANRIKSMIEETDSHGDAVAS